MTTRRGHNEGTIYQRSDGRYRAQLTLPDGTRKSFSGKTKREVQRKLGEARVLLVQGRLATGPDQTVEQLLTEWLQNVAAPSVSYHTYESYEISLRVRLIPRLGRIWLRELSSRHIQEAYADLSKTLAPKTIRLTHVPLNQAMQLAVDWGMIPSNPAAQVRLPKITDPEKTILTPEQVAHLLASTRDHQLYPLLQLLLTTGMRKGEALGLKWADVDWKARTISIHRQVIRKTGEGLVLEDLKTVKSRRTIPLGSRTLAVLADLREHRDGGPAIGEELLPSKPEYQGLIFKTDWGRPYDPTTVWAVFQDILDDCGLPRMTLHALRDTAATTMLISGIDAKTISERLGHSDVGLTLRVYSHVTPGMHRDAAERLERMYEQAEPAANSGDDVSCIVE